MCMCIHIYACMSICAHTCKHLWQHVHAQPAYGVRPENNSQEWLPGTSLRLSVLYSTYFYLLSHLTSQILLHLKKYYFKMDKAAFGECVLF